jgi:hypothetical protein
MGGFGNVLFQILTARILEKKGYNIKYCSNLVGENFITRMISWKIHDNAYYSLIDNSALRRIKPVKAVFIISMALISKKIGLNLRISSFNDDLKTVEKAKNIFGYFQNKSHLTKYQKEIVLLGMMLNKKLKLNCDNSTDVVVHYRKGDSEWALRSLSYYGKVHDIIKKHENNVLVVTDSKIDANAFFSDCKNLKIIQSSCPVEDFRYLISAKKLYCAPSTFSWWAMHSAGNEIEVIMPRILESKLGIYKAFKNITIIDS